MRFLFSFSLFVFCVVFGGCVVVVLALVGGEYSGEA